MNAIVSRLQDACTTHGATLLQESDDGTLQPKHVPISAQPLIFSPAVLEHAFKIMPVWNKLIDAACRNPRWLLDVMRGSDPDFTEKLLDIMERVYVRRPPEEWEQRAMLGIFRSDYLLDAASAGADGTVGGGASTTPLRHVEINTIACAFAGLSTRAGLVHRALASEDVEPIVSESEETVAAAIHEAHKWWCNKFSRDAIVVFVVQQGERNSADQQLLMSKLADLGTKSVRLSLLQLGQMDVSPEATATVSTPDGVQSAVSVFYHRALYDLRDFPDESSWATRERLERTNAIKCPSLPFHMCGCKRVQQRFTRRDVLEQFITPEEADMLLSCMVPQYLLHTRDEEADAAVADACANPSKYVLKTQEEATGRLFAGQQVVDMLSVPEGDPRYSRIRHDHLLMERIRGQRFDGAIVRDGKIAEGLLESEFGTYGTVFSDGQRVVSNRAAGYVVRTKFAASEGGGVMSGVSVLDVVAVKR